MKRSFYLVSILFLIAQHCFAQAPQLTVDGKTNNGVRLQALTIDINVCGTVARTSWQMTFKNTTGRILEGNLNFPLKDGLNVSRYALDINGKMREAVPVDRGKATAVFEAIERRGVDPGLLEKVDGNTFRTRIYPINPNSTRTVIIGYEEELPLNAANALQYRLPLALKEAVNEFSVNIHIIQSAQKPVFDPSLNDNLAFTGSSNLYTAAFTRQQYVPDHALAFSIPKPADAAEIMLQPFENNYCFLINTRVQPGERPKKMPASLGLLWDASLSGSGRNINKELSLLNAYFKKAGNIPVTLVCFSNSPMPSRQFTVKDGNWDDLKKALLAVNYDGATNLGALDLKRIDASEFILVSDGRQTIGDKPLSVAASKPVYCINSAVAADHSALKLIALKSGGQLVDLEKADSVAALQLLINEPFRFLGIKQNAFVKEVYPSLPVAVNSNFSLAGMVAEGAAHIVLQFGYGNTVTTETTLTVNTATQLCQGFDITKVFAQKKIAELDIQYEKNRQEEERTGKKFGIVTRNTSLMVLENLNDYIQYEIEPPAELREEYNRIMKQRGTDVITKNNNELRTSLDMMQALQTWYGAGTAVPVRPVTQNADKVITGRITDNKGKPVAGAAIRIPGSSTGTTADNNGRYRLTARQGNALQVSAVGYNSRQVILGSGETYNMILDDAQQALEEVVVTGYASTRSNSRERSYSGSVARVDPNVILQKSEPDVLKGLQGKVAGVDIRSGQSTPGAATRIQIRGNSSFYGNEQPLIVVDGIPYSNDQLSSPSGQPYGSAIGDIDPNNIASMNILKGSSAGALFGSRASNGVIIITTKTGGATGRKAFDQLVDSIAHVDRAEVAKLVPDVEPFDHLKDLKLTAKENRYERYLALRSDNINKPVYFFEVGSYFLKTGDKEAGLRILSNLAELENGSYESYKMLGYKLKEAGEFEGELSAFKKVLELRPLDPQSYRDCALAYEDNGDSQQALDMLYQGMTKSYSNEMKQLYGGIEEIFLTEMNRLIAVKGRQVKLTGIAAELVQPMPADLRVVMNWNMNNTDIDLWVTDPNDEKCFYSHKATAIGGRMSRDFTQGFGPEQFLLKKGIKGKYTIQINYYGDRQVTLAGPTTIMAEIYLHYGTPNEEKRIVTLQMEKGKQGEVFIGEVEL